MAPDFSLKDTSDKARDNTLLCSEMCLLYRHKDLSSGLDPHKKAGRDGCHMPVIPALGRGRHADPDPCYLATSKLWRHPVSEKKGEARVIVLCARVQELLKSSELT